MTQNQAVDGEKLRKLVQSHTEEVTLVKSQD